jgi:predicted flap endonuclease-1-like 5' DNA nuclease
MLYLLAASAEWLAAALALGLVVGFWTTTKKIGAKFDGHGVIVASAFALAGGFFVANLQTIPGRNGLFLELGLLFASAYLIGLPFGGGVRLLFGTAAPAAPAKKKPPHVVLRGVAALTEDPPTAAPIASVPAPAAEAGIVVASEAEPPAAPRAAAPAAEPRRRAAASGAPRPAESEKKAPGQRPEGLDAPRGGRADDLTKIKGLGPKSVEKLHGLGVYHFDQIAGWSSENVAWIGATLAVPGRPERGRWVAQARELAGAKSEAAAERAQAE